jgi:glycerol-3-phosphate dehydrogenase (NAD(P)+)
MKIAVIGAGAWGTTLANVFARKGLETVLWAREREVVGKINRDHENSWYLPGITLDERLQATTDVVHATEGAEYFVWVVPAQYTRKALEGFRPHLPKKPTIICANKGIELKTLMTMSQVVDDVLAPLKPRFAMLSGPSFADEVSRDIPTTVTLGCADEKRGKAIQETLSSETFRIYTTTDYRGVELGGALKNIMAIAAGVSDGLNFGSNARAALITRGLAEMSRLGEALGAKGPTFQGLSGLGDLVLTCTGDSSRNRQVGLKLGQGQRLVDILEEMRSVAEGVKTTEAVYTLGQKLGVSLPITEQLYDVLYNDKNPQDAVHELMTRGLKDE